MQINVSDFFLRNDFHLTDCLGSMSCNDPTLFTNGCFLAPNSRWENFVNIFGGLKIDFLKALVRTYFFVDDDDS